MTQRDERTRCLAKRYAADPGPRRRRGRTIITTTLTATFETRREAEMTVERLVQEHGIERTNVFIAAEGLENSAGEEKAGSDGEAGAPSPEPRGDAPLQGAVNVSVDIEHDANVAKVREAFTEFDADHVSEV